MSNLPPLVARLIGIDNYNKYPKFHSWAAINADKLQKFLQEELFQGDHHDIQSFKDVTRDTIINQLISLQKTFERNQAILFFFSGAGGKKGNTSIICPADIGEKVSGISDQELVQFFDMISRTRGNNITFFLDCPSATFEWGNPNSFVVVAPSRVDTSNRGAFTDSIINVLRSEIELNGSIELLTVQSLVDKLHIVMPAGVDIECHGQNVDRPLFNSLGSRAHYAFISGIAEKDGSFTLSAGRAHGIQIGAVYSIYGSQIVVDQNKRLGYLSVFSVNNATRSVLHGFSLDQSLPLDTPSLPNFYVPLVFYAVETRSPHQTVEIFSGDNVDIATIKSPCWKEADQEKANITLKLTDGKVEFLWNGFAEPSMRVETRPDNYLSVPKDNRELIKAAKRAARFTYYAGLFPDSVSSPLFGVMFKGFDKNIGEPTGKNLLNDGLVDLQITQHNRDRTFCLVIRNNSNVPIWPFVFMCEPRNFSILPWYTPTKALGVMEDLLVGDDDDSLALGWRPKSKIDLCYIKIFVTKKPTSFSFLQQNGVSPEDELREVDQETTTPFDRRSSSGNAPPGTTESFTNRSTDEKAIGWDAMQITIKRTYETEEKSDNNRLPFRFRQLGLRSVKF